MRGWLASTGRSRPKQDDDGPTVLYRVRARAPATMKRGQPLGAAHFMPRMTWMSNSRSFLRSVLRFRPNKLAALI